MPTEKPADDLSPAELRQHMEDMRRELVGDKLRIIELQDEIRMRQTDHADAISLLGQAELQLEGKIEYILNLDHSLNARIKELEDECDRKSEEIDRRGEVIAAAEARDKKNREERDAIISDLSERLETANQEIGKAHELARDIDQDRAAKIDLLNKTEAQLTESRASLEAVQGERESAHRDISGLKQEIESHTASLARTEASLQKTTNELESTRNRVKAAEAHRRMIESSSLWKISRPWRALFGPK